MNLDSLSISLSQISYIITNLTKKNYKSSQLEINSIIENQGFEAERHLYRCLFSSIDFNSETANNTTTNSSNTSNKPSGKDIHQIQYLRECLPGLLSKSYCITILSFAINNPLQFQESQKSQVYNPNSLTHISKLLNLNKIQEIIVFIAFLNSNKEELRLKSQELIRQKLSEIVNPFLDQNLNLSELPTEVLQLVLIELRTFLKSNQNHNINISEFYSKLRKDIQKDKIVPILVPYLYPDEDIDQQEITPINIKKSIMENSIEDLIQDIGYSFTSSVDDCRNSLLTFGQSIKDLLTPKSVARVMGLMARTHDGQNYPQYHNQNWSFENQTWNVDVFVQTVQELVPNLSWKEVIREFDYPEFLVKDKHALRLLVNSLKRVLRDNFPIELFYKLWKNSEGQLSWFIQSLKNPDVFCIADYQCKRTATEILKAQPEDDNRLIASWRSLSLIEILLMISDLGPFLIVFDLFKFPLTHCPDLLFLGLLQLSTTWNKMKQELINNLIPIFLGNHPNSAVVLQYAWNQNSYTNNLRALIMNSMADWYTKASDLEQNTRLARILDVSQDLKALFVLLNGQPMLFNIDLACLAARRGYLKLDKWMCDRIRDHTDKFISTVVAFLRKKLPHLNNAKEDFNASSIRSQQETIQTILKCISASANSVNPELSQEILQITTEARLLLDKQNSILQKVLSIQTPNQTPTGGPTSSMDLLAMMNNINAQNMGFNSPSKLLTANPLGLSAQSFAALNGNAQVTSSLSGINNGNLFLNNNLDSNKVAMLNNLINNPLGMRPPNTPATNGSSPYNNIAGNSGYGSTNAPGSTNDTASYLSTSYQKEIEIEVENCIQRLFKGASLTVEEFATYLLRCKESGDQREKDFYAYSLKFLIDGNTCLYSLDEAQFHTMAKAWGVLIDRGILSNQILNYCFKILLGMLNKSINTKNFYFVCKVLDYCKNRLREYPEFCALLMQSVNFQEFPKILKDYVEYGSKGLLPIIASLQPQPSLTPTNLARTLSPPVTGLPFNTNQQQTQRSLSSLPGSSLNSPSLLQTQKSLQMSPQAPLMQPSNVQIPNMNLRSLSGKPSIANTTNIDTLLVAGEADQAARPNPPSDVVQDKISFIFNNLSLSNMQSKGDELRDAVKDDFWEWIAHYLVVKRVSIEPNFHILYSQFVDTLRKEVLNEAVLNQTFRNIKVLLRSDKNDQKFCDRALLKNLGSWLGLITLAKNKPILHRDLDLKSLVVEAFQKGQAELLFVVPFVAKVLEPAGKSKVFGPPNPWLMAMLSVLVELHNEPDLKLNHKFEIEVLCKNLNINITSIPIKNVLRTFEVVEEQLNKRNDPAMIAAAAAQQQQATPITPLQQPIATNTPPSAIGDQLPNVDPSANQAIPVQLPKFKLSDIKIQGMQSNAHLVFINPEITIFNAQPALKQLIIPALDKAVTDMIQHLLDKAVKIAVSTAEPMIKKDFSLDPDENHMRIAARNMVANMSAGMMLITGKESLSSYMMNILRAHLTQPLDVNLANAFKDMINQACNFIVQDNIELCMCYLQKIAIQKSIVEIERKLQSEFEMRQRARSEGRAHYEPKVLAYHNEKMPEMLKLRVGSVTQNQFAVYEEFGKNLPGFKVHSDERASNFAQVYDEMNVHYERLILILDQELVTMQIGNPLTVNLQALIQSIQEFKATQQPTSATNLVKKLVYNLLDPTFITEAPIEAYNRFRDAHISVFKVILSDQRFVSGSWAAKEVTKVWIESPFDFRYYVDGVATLIKLKVLPMQTVDIHVAQVIDTCMPKGIIFGTQLVRCFYIENSLNYHEIDFNHIIEALSKVSSRLGGQSQNTELRDILEVIRMNYDNLALYQDRICATALSMMYTGVTQARDFEDPPTLKEKSENLLQEWIQHHSILATKEYKKAFQNFVLQMNGQGLFKTDEMITRFFRICTELCVESCSLNIAKGQRAACYQRLDAFVKLIILLVQHSGDPTNHINKINLFNKVLGLIAGCLLYDQETKGSNFEPMPYHRLFYMLLFEATLPENYLDQIITHVLQAFVNVYHIVRPTKAPGFAFSWLELISHRIFIVRMLQMPQQNIDAQIYKPWNMYSTLLNQLIRFMSPFLRNIELTQGVMLLYKGTLRLFLVLLHDFPEFLCSYHYQLCDVIPSNCIQLRNLVLSAFPRLMKLPDPLTPNLKVDMIGDIDSNPPKITFPYIYNIPQKLKADLDSYIKIRAPVTFLSDLRTYLQTYPDVGCHYNIQLMNALVIYVGSLGIQALRAKNLTPSLQTLTHSAHSPHSDIFQSLVVDLDSEGRFLFINAVANQLRYPNSHTHYFSCALLNLFSEANSEAIQEQITRVLLERLIVNRPHPWGLLVTFIELIKNPQFKFWNHQFVRCAPEIEKFVKIFIFK